MWTLAIAGREIRAVRSVVNPDKLAHLRLMGDLTALLTHDLHRVDGRAG